MPTASGHTTAIRATRTIGKDIFNAAGEKIGQVEDIILDKASNRIMFAVISCGGALTATDHFYSLPWSVLDYNEETGAYVVPYSSDQVTSGPAASMLSDLTKNDGLGPRAAVYRHYNLERDW